MRISYSIIYESYDVLITYVCEQSAFKLNIVGAY